MKIESVVVFCGSKTGQNPLFMKHAAELGKLIALLNLRMVYGGGKAGLMGAIANAVLANGGKVMGVIPKILTEWEHQHEGLTELFVVPDMHTRKKMMYEMCDAAIVMPEVLAPWMNFLKCSPGTNSKYTTKKYTC